MMQRGPVRFTIEGVEYEHTILTTTKGARIASYVATTIAPLIADAYEDGSELDVPDLIRKAAVLLSRDTELLLSFCMEFARTTTVIEGDRKVPLDRTFETHFQGAYKRLGLYVYECAKVMLSDFFDMRGALGPRTAA